MAKRAAERTKLPYYLWYPADFQSDGPVTMLNPIEELMYRRLLDYQWLNGAVPIDEEGAMRAARLADNTVITIYPSPWKMVEQFFPVDGAVRRNRRLVRQRKATDKLIKAKSRAGKKGMASRWKRNNTAITGTVTNDNHREPEPDIHRTPPLTRERVIDGKAGGVMTKVLADGGEEYLPDFERAFRSSHSPESLADVITALFSGLNGPGGRPVPATVIGAALRDIALKGEKVTGKLLGIFVASNMKSPTTSGAKPFQPVKVL